MIQSKPRHKSRNRFLGPPQLRPCLSIDHCSWAQEKPRLVFSSVIPRPLCCQFLVRFSRTSQESSNLFPFHFNI